MASAYRRQLLRERERKRIEQLAIVHVICGGVLPIEQSQTLPNGDRLTILNVPLNPDYDKTFDLLIVRIANEKHYDFSTREETVGPVGYATFCSNKQSGFTSSSGTRGCGTDEDTLWEIVRYRYFDWK